MPEIGEITTGRKIGWSGGGEVIWDSCMDCGKERWVAHEKGKFGKRETDSAALLF
jgi:hypothetical protein